MKIVSLQSVGLGDVEPVMNESLIARPSYYEVGECVPKFGYMKNGKEPIVTEIDFGDMYDGSNLPRQEDTYFVYTPDGHIRVLPADKYIAEWAE